MTGVQTCALPILDFCQGEGSLVANSKIEEPAILAHQWREWNKKKFSNKSVQIRYMQMGIAKLRDELVR